MTNVDILQCIPLFIEKLFEILSTNPKHDVYEMSLNQLKTYLIDYEQYNNRSIKLDIQIMYKILKFLNKPKGYDIEKNKYFAIIWLEKFLSYFTEDMMKDKDSKDNNYFSSEETFLIEDDYKFDEMTESEAESKKK